ncbi:sensor histidine kinase [Sphingomonas sp.]|uniref:sensor histidine kinase n=1 Tax=Sphingomonas sp. TaxID=28214 RepID=UPI003B00731F
MGLPRILRSTSAGFFALVFLLQLVSGTALLLYVRHIIADELERTSRTLVTSLRDDLVASYAQEGEIGVRTLIAARLAGSHARDAAVLLDDPVGNHLAGNIAEWPPPLSFSAGWRVLTLYRVGRDRPEPMGVVAATLPGGQHLLVGHVIEGDLRVRRLTGEAMIAALLLAVPLALFGAVVATRVVTIRVERVAETARAVGAGDLSLRVPIDADARDAFTELGRAINAMLARIEALVGELRVVTDSLAHDLRSPLTRLRVTIERATRETEDDVALAALDRVAGDAEALLAMLGTALQISRAEAGIGRDSFVVVDLGRMAEDLAEMYGALAEEHGMTLVAEGAIAARVQRELLGQALANLVDNAIKYGRAGGFIRISAGVTGDRILLSVDDNGPGIPEHRRAEALRRFGRLDPARGADGAGLGLALAAAVARLHGGELRLGDNRPGLSVTIELPA